MKKIFILALLFTLLISNNEVFSKDKMPTENQKKAAEITLEYMNLNWWKRFNDDYLINHLLNVYKNNYDLKNTELKIKENEKLVQMQFASQLPFLNIAGDINRDLRAPMQQFGSSMQIPNYSQTNYFLPLTMGYEIDIWGSNRFKTKSVKEQLEIIRQAQRATYISLTSDFSSDYFNLIKADKLLELQDELVKTQEKIVELTSEKYKAGLCSINDVLAEESFLTSLKEERNKHEHTQKILEESIKVYLASDNKEEIIRNNYQNIVLLKDIPVNYSSEIIENRPDFKQEEANIRKIGFDVKVAKREFLPKFTIVGQIGLNAYNIGKLFNSPSQFANLGVLPSFDLFSGGRKMAFFKFKKFQYEEALNDYKQTILEGIKEVNSGILEYKTAISNYEESNKRLTTQSKIFELAKDKNTIGTSGNIDLLYAKEAYLISQKEEVSNKINSIISTIGLYKAAGGVDLYSLNQDI